MLLFSSNWAKATDYEDLPAELFPPSGWIDDEWTDPEGWITIDVSQNGLPANDSSINAGAKVKQILNNSTGNRILYFPAGDYWFTNKLFIKQDGVRLVGDGPALTKFYQTNSEITFEHSNTGSVDLPLNEPLPTRGATSIQTSLAGAASLSVGEFILPVAQFPWGGQKDSYKNQMSKLGVGQIVQITEIDGTTVHFSEPLGLDYTPWAFPRIRTMSMLKNVGVEGIAFEKTVPDDRMVLNFDHVENAYVKNVHMYKVDKTGIEVRDSYRMFVVDSHFTESHSYGAGGHGYGVRYLNNTTRSYILNNKFYWLRHAVVLQTGANHNVIAYNASHFKRSYDNLLLHGNYPHNNLFEGNYAENEILFDKVHGMNGPYNTVFRNHVRGNRAGNGTDGIITQGSSIVGMIIGNVTTRIWERDYDYLGLNRLVRDEVTGETIDVVLPGELASDASLPDSLFLNSKPDFLFEMPWPMAGPDLGADWGEANRNQAAIRDLYYDDPSAPTCQILSPADGSELTSGDFSIQVDASDDTSVSHVELRTNGKLVAIKTAAPYTFTFTDHPNGAYRYNVRAYDDMGLVSTDIVAVSISGSVDPDQPPTVAITSPEAGSSYEPPADLVIEVSADDPDGQVARVELYKNGALADTISTAPYRFAISGLSANNYVFQAIAYDNHGFSAQASISLSVGSTIPAGQTIEAESRDANSGVGEASGGTGTKINNINNGDWLRFDAIDFGAGASRFHISASNKQTGGNVEVRLDSLGGDVLGTATVAPTGNWNTFVTFSTDLDPMPTGVHDLFVVFTGGSGSLMDVDWIQFESFELVYQGDYIPKSTPKIEMVGAGFSIMFANSASSDVELLPQVCFDLSQEWLSGAEYIEEEYLGVSGEYLIYRATSKATIDDEPNQFMRVIEAPEVP